MRPLIALLFLVAAPAGADSSTPGSEGHPSDLCAGASDCVAAPADCSGRCRAIARHDAAAYRTWMAQTCMGGIGARRDRDDANCAWKLECAEKRCRLLPPPLPGGATIDRITEISLLRGGCEGSCPQYSMVLRSDGSAAYEGGAFVERTGKQAAKISAADFRALAELLARTDFFR